MFKKKICFQNLPAESELNSPQIVSTSNLLVIPQNDDIHYQTMIATDALIEDLVSFHFSNLPLDLKWIPLIFDLM